MSTALTLKNSTSRWAILARDTERIALATRRRLSSDASSSSHQHQRLPFSKSSLGLDKSFILPCLDSIRQLPEVETAWTDCHERKNLDPLHRAVNIFQSMSPNGGEHVAVNALIAEVQHRQGRHDEALLTLDELGTQLYGNESLVIPHSSDDILLAKAKVHWTQGNFAISQEICESLISNYDDLQETFPTTPLHLASAMTGKALSQLASMSSMSEAFSVRDYFRVALKFLERHPTPNALPLAVAHGNAGLAEAVYNLFVEEHNDVSVPMDSALKTWFQGLRKIEQYVSEDSSADGQVFRASKFLQASLQGDLAWGILNYEYNREDRIKKASEYAKKALDALGPESTTQEDGVRRVLATVACCYHQAGSAVTAEGLYQSATSQKIPPNGSLQYLELQDAMLGYSNLLSEWDKREGDANRLKEDSAQLREKLPEAWRGKSGIHSSLWFWTPADFY